MRKLVTLFCLFITSVVSAQTTQPATAIPLLRWQQIYWTGNPFFKPDVKAPQGMDMMINDGGLRFDDDLSKPGYQENSAWFGEYTGPKLYVDFVDLSKFSKAWDVATFYTTDIEHWPFDLRPPPGQTTGPSDAEVQNSINKFSAMMDALNASRPDMIWGTYGIAPIGSHYAPTNWQMSVDAYEKWKRGEALTSNDTWALGGGFTKTASGYYKFNPNGSFTKDMQAWTDACLRMTYNTDGKGNKLSAAKSGPSLVQRMRVLCPELYQWTPGNPSVVNRAHIRWQVGMARRLTNGKGVVYGYIWNRVHVGDMPLMTLNDFRIYVKMVFQTGIDGVICWGFDDPYGVDAPYLQIVIEEREFASRQPASYFMDWKMDLNWPDSFRP